MKRHTFRNILVPTDFSEPANAAWRCAQDLAQPFKSRLHLLHVVAPAFLYDPWGTEAAALRMAEAVTSSEDAARKQLSKLVPRGESNRVVIATVTGQAVEEILAYAEAKHVDLVVIGTHGRGLVGQLLLGSVAERVVKRCPVPVLMVHGAPRPARRRRPRKST
jgi:nucleotide-binding universal stress UspA family protein